MLDFLQFRRYTSKKSTYFGRLYLPNRSTEFSHPCTHGCFTYGHIADKLIITVRLSEDGNVMAFNFHVWTSVLSPEAVIRDCGSNLYVGMRVVEMF